MQIGLLAVLTLPFDTVRATTEISPSNKTNNDTNPSSVQVRHVYPGGRSTFMTDHREDDTTERLLEPSDTPISEGTIRAVVVVGLITLFVASFLYWQSWKERHKKPPCVTKLRLGISDVVKAQRSRVWATGPRRKDGKYGDQRDQQSYINGAKPGRIEPKIFDPSPVRWSSHSTTSLPSESSSIYHSSISSQMIFISETVKPRRESGGVILTVGQLPKGYNSSTLSMPSEQLILHV